MSALPSISTVTCHVESSTRLLYFLGPALADIGADTGHGIRHTLLPILSAPASRQKGHFTKGLIGTFQRLSYSPLHVLLCLEPGGILDAPHPRPATTSDGFRGTVIYALLRQSDPPRIKVAAPPQGCTCCRRASVITNLHISASHLAPFPPPSEQQQQQQQQQQALSPP